MLVLVVRLCCAVRVCPQCPSTKVSSSRLGKGKFAQGSLQAGLGLAARIGHRKKIGTPEISVRGNCLLVICYCRAGWGMQSLSVYSATPHKNRLLSPGKKGECVVGTQSSLCQVSSLCDPQSELLPPS